MKKDGKGAEAPPSKVPRTVELDGAASHRSFEGGQVGQSAPDRRKPGKIVRPAKGELSPRD